MDLLIDIRGKVWKRPGPLHFFEKIICIWGATYTCMKFRLHITQKTPKLKPKIRLTVKHEAIPRLKSKVALQNFNLRSNKTIGSLFKQFEGNLNDFGRKIF